MAKAASKIPPEKAAAYDKLIATNPKIERKGATTGYTSHGGHMYTFLSPTGELAIRLGRDDREAFLKKYKTKLFKAYGTVLVEYVAVPDEMIGKTSVLKKYLDLSYAYVKTLRPKASAKKKK
jgi:hypothetical protein